MANLHLVTGYAGKEHITSNDQGSFNAAIMGNGEFVLERGRQFEAQVISNNMVRIFDGDLLMQGRHIRLKENTYVDLFFENGTQGYKRTDLIAVRYEKDATTDVENANLVVIKGVPSENSYVMPEKITGDIINDHALQNDTVLYQVKFDGLGIQEPEKVFSTLSTIETELENVKNEMINDIDKYIQEKIEIVDEKLKINTFDNAGIVAKAPKPDRLDLYSGYPLEYPLTWQQVPSNGAQPRWYQDWRCERSVIYTANFIGTPNVTPSFNYRHLIDPMYFEVLIEFIDVDKISSDINYQSTVYKTIHDATNIYREMEYYGSYGKKAGYKDSYYKKDSRKITETFSLYNCDSNYTKIGDFTVIYHFAVNTDYYSIEVIIDKVYSSVTLSNRKYLYFEIMGTGTSKFA